MTPVLAIESLTLRSVNPGSLNLSRLPHEHLETVVRLFVATVDRSNEIARFVLTACAVALRPLRLDEIECLIKLHNAGEQSIQPTSDVQSIISHDCGNMLGTYDGFVFFRHPVFRNQWLDAHHRGPVAAQEQQSEMIRRLLQYLAGVQGDPTDLTFEAVSHDVIDGTIHSYPLLEYAFNYWTNHYTRSRPSSSHALDAGYSMSSFPASVFVANLQATYWMTRPMYEILPASAIFAEASRSIGPNRSQLQFQASLVTAFKERKQLTKAANTLADAFYLAQQILPDFDPFIVSCITRYMETIDGLDDRNGIQTCHKPEMLKYLIRMHEQTDPSSDLALHFNHQLWQHYAEASNGDEAAGVLRRIYTMQVHKYGKSSTEAKSTSKTLMKVLQDSGHREDDLLQDDSVFDDIIHSFEPTDPRRIKAALSKAESCHSRADLVDAELIYATLWHDISRQKQDGLLASQQESEVGLHYANFLTDNDRLPEAQSVLLAIWSRYKHLGEPPSSMNVAFRQLSLALGRARLPAVALEVLSSISARQDPETVEDTEGQFQNNLNILLNSGSHMEMNHTIESSLSRTLFQRLELSQPELDSSTIELIRMITGRLKDDRRWVDLIEICRRMLSIFWSQAFDGEDNLLTDAEIRFDPTHADVAFALGQAYEMTNDVERAASVYRNVFMVATQADENIESWVSRSFYAATASYGKLDQVKPVIHMHQRLLDYFCMVYGDDHERTVELLYKLAALCSQSRNVQDATRYYARIADIYSRGDYHEKAALPALTALATILQEQELWLDLEGVYRSLWVTFLTKGKDFGIDAEAAKDLYDRYMKFLRTKLSAAPDALCNVTEEYWRGCLASFGDRHLVTFEAASLLAGMCDKECGDDAKAADMYEWILRSATTSSDLSVVASYITSAETFLTSFYQQRLDDDLDEETIKNVVQLQRKRYHTELEKSGLLTPASLDSLSHYIAFLHKDGSPDSQHVIIDKLRTAVETVIQSKADPASLHRAAITLASCYADSDNFDSGLEILQELRQRLIFWEMDSDLREVNDPPANLGFLSSFEARLSNATSDLAEVHARAIVEFLLWRNYQILSRSGAQPEIVLACGAKLRKVLFGHGLAASTERLEQSMFTIFMKGYGDAFKTDSERIRQFFMMFISELGNERLEIDVLRSVCVSLDSNICHLLEQCQWSSVLDLAIPGLQLLQYLNAYSNVTHMKTGFDLSLKLAGKGGFSIPDRSNPMGSQLLDASRNVLSEVIGQCRGMDFDLNSMSIEYLSRVASILGLQQNYEDLEVRTFKPTISAARLTSIVASHQALAWSP